MLNNALTNIAAVIFVLGIMMVVHEWGHFIIARLFKVRVEVFSFFGLGPRLWGFKRGDTDFRISAIPIGAYVLMAGERPDEPKTGAPDEFTSKPKWQRALIVLAGPVANLLLAVILLSGLFLVMGLPYPAYLTRPAEVAALPRGSAAAAAGILPGDRIVKVNDAAVTTWEQVRAEFTKVVAGGGQVNLEVERGEEIAKLSVPLAEKPEFFTTFGFPYVPARIDGVSPGMPADKAGLRPDDELLKLNGQPIRTWYQFAEGIRHSDGQEVELQVRRGRREFTVRLRAVQGQFVNGVPLWQIGVLPYDDEVFRRVSPWEAIESGVIASVNGAQQIIQVVGRLFTGQESIRNMQSVIGISREAGQAAKRGPVRLVYLMAVISLNLGILNLLPIPVLDGGLILMLALEGLRRKEFSMKIKERCMQFGWVLLLALFVYVMYNDVLRLLPGR